MSSKIQGLRRVGIVGLSTVVAASMMTLSAASSFALIGDYKAVSVEAVAQDSANQTAGDLTLEFANNWNTGATQSFTVTSTAGANNCTTAAGIAHAVSFSADPTATVSDPLAVNSILDTAPNFTVTHSGSSAACATVGVFDVVTITQAAPSTGPVSDNWLVTLSGVEYNVGSTVPVGNISVATAGAFKASGSVVNAVVPGASLTNVPERVAAAPSALGVSLGTQKFDEVTPGAIFAAGAATTVTLTLDAGTFTVGLPPTITAPTGYVVTAPIAPTAVDAYSFTVTAPTPAVAATVRVSGLKSDVGATVSTRTITATGTAFAGTLDTKVVNVLDFAARTGGASRYETAAMLFELGNFDSNDVVLSSGEDFPDALSANYLAGELGTGTLLTKPATLHPAARAQIVRAGISTVYITGETGAVSQTVQNQIEAMHVGDAADAPLITTVRLGGANRYDTNRIVNTKAFRLAGTGDTAFLASGEGFADALAVGPVAYDLNYPVILTKGKTLGASENNQLALFTNVNNVVIAGGLGVVSQAVETSVKSQGFAMLRLAGADRTQTAAEVATWATVGQGVAPFSDIRASRGFNSDETYVARGDDFADALAAGPVAGSQAEVIVLTKVLSTLGVGTPAYLGTKAVGTESDEVGVLHALGGVGAVPASLMTEAAASISIP